MSPTDAIVAIFFNVSLEEVSKAEESVTDDITELADGGYLAILGVYHELHCLVSIVSHQRSLSC